MTNNGKVVLCVVGNTPEGPIEQPTSRAVCLTKPKEQCQTCPNSSFRMAFQFRAVDQLVACPRWESAEAEKEGRDPLDYEMVRRDTCLRLKPFTFCSSCPNGKYTAAPRSEPRWVEEEARLRRIELELDEEARE